MIVYIIEPDTDNINNNTIVFLLNMAEESLEKLKEHYVYVAVASETGYGYKVWWKNSDSDLTPSKRASMIVDLTQDIGNEPHKFMLNDLHKQSNVIGYLDTDSNTIIMYGINMARLTILPDGSFVRVAGKIDKKGNIVLYKVNVDSKEE